MLAASLDSVTIADLTRLKDYEVLEGRQLDYKLKLPGNSDGDKVNFLRDVSALANTQGGDILYGVEEKAGLPVALPGCEMANLDALKLDLGQRCLNGLEPSLTGLGFHAVPVSDTRSVLILRVPESYLKPHRVTLKLKKTFYARNDGGNYQMSVDDLRQSFVQGETLARQIRDFQAARLDTIRNRELPFHLDPGAVLVTHIVPLSLLGSLANLDLLALERHIRGQRGLYYTRPGEHRFNADGFVEFLNRLIGTEEKPNVTHYRQWFRRGPVEIANIRDLRPGDNQGVNELLDQFEIPTLLSVRSSLESYQALGVPPPFIVTLSLVDAADYKIRYTTDGRFPVEFLGLDSEKPHDDRILAGELRLEGLSLEVEDLSRGLKPLFDGLWQAFGVGSSPNYDGELHNADTLDVLKRKASQPRTF